MKALVAALVVVAAGCGSSGGDEPLLVAAASDVRPAFDELGERYTEVSGRAVRFVYGSSGQLAAQLAEGAPYDLFVSADRGYVDAVVDARAGDADSVRAYAVGRLALWSADGPPALVDLPRLDGPVAIANPAHAPYGRAAAQALETAGVAGALDGRLVHGQNVVDAKRLAASGNAEAGIVALSLALADDDGHWCLLDAALHEPIVQTLVVTAGDARGVAQARAFADLLAGADGREVLARYGFAEPGETVTEPPAAAEGREC